MASGSTEQSRNFISSSREKLYPIEHDLYCNVACFKDEAKIHIRKWFPPSESGYSAPSKTSDSVVLYPTKLGACFSKDELMRLKELYPTLMNDIAKAEKKKCMILEK